MEIKNGGLEELMKSELKLLFNAICNGLCQEVQQHSLANLVTGQDFSLTKEREAGVASALAWHLRSIGFVVQLESYFARGDPRKRPDFCIWLPAIRKYGYFELKTVA